MSKGLTEQILRDADSAQRRLRRNGRPPHILAKQQAERERKFGPVAAVIMEEMSLWDLQWDYYTAVKRRCQSLEEVKANPKNISKLQVYRINLLLCLYFIPKLVKQCNAEHHQLLIKEYEHQERMWVNERTWVDQQLNTYEKAD